MLPARRAALVQSAATQDRLRRSKAQRNDPLPTSPQFDKDQDLDAYREMLLIRRFEEKAGQMYGMGLIGGFCHLYIGQEAVVVGMQMATKRRRPGDHRLPRPRPHARLRHGPEGRDGRADRPPRRLSKGKGGSMHMFSNEKNFYGGHGIVGAQVSARHRHRLRQPLSRERQCVPDLFRRRRGQPGPGLRELQHGASSGSCRSSTSSRTTATPWAPRSSRASAQTDFSKRGVVVQHSRRAGRRHGCARGRRRRRKRAIEHARAGKGPYILEMQTYRYRGHSMSDPAKYRTKDEVRADARGARSDRAGAPPPAARAGS